MSLTLVGILDYGCGNTFSVQQSLKKMGYRSCLIEKSHDFNKVSALIIPGVGAFPEAMTHIHNSGLIEGLLNFHKQGNKIIGICLGMQMLADVSYEQGETKGLGLIPGEVKPIEEPEWHIGWNNLQNVTEHSNYLMDGESYYFNHSFYFSTKDKYITSFVNVGKNIAASVQNENVIGLQFHPEKSQLAGFQLIESILEQKVYAH